MYFVVQMNVMCFALGGKFRDELGGWCEPTLEFDTVKELLAFLNGVPRNDEDFEIEDYVEVVRREGRVIRRALKGRSGKELKQVTADVRRALKKVREPWGVE